MAVAASADIASGMFKVEGLILASLGVEVLAHVLAAAYSIMDGVRAGFRLYNGSPCLPSMGPELRGGCVTGYVRPKRHSPRGSD